MTVGDPTDRLTHGLRHHIANSLGWPQLRPLQAAAIGPILDGADTLLLAPTAGGKTEAAVFPLLSAMTDQRWSRLSVLYVRPLRALLNNLQPRIDSYAAWLGRRAALWHGDTTAGARKRLRAEPSDILLTTPESLEALLVSTLVTPAQFFAGLRAVVVDEVHAFAGDDRGWHLLAVLARLSRLAGRQIQRIGLSATIGNPDELLDWLRAGNTGPAQVIAPDTNSAGGSTPEVALDYVGSVPNAATVVSRLHRGEKRLVFAESRRRVEELALHLRAAGTTTFVSHSSLSVDQRRQAETAFADARDCVIVATSTLELGIDVGDLDRVIQIDAPTTVAAFLQRLGRTGRRTGSSRNTLLLATTKQALVHGAGLLDLWRSGYVEPISAPPAPRHIAAQQLLALALQEGRYGDNAWQAWWDGLPLFDEHAGHILNWLITSEHLTRDDDGMLYIGPQAERRYGKRHFMDLLAVFTAAPQYTVLHGRTEIGAADPLMLITKREGPRLLSLGGRAWRVTHIDWNRHRCYVETSDQHARSAWTGSSRPHSYALSQAHRRILLGTDPGVTLSRRATDTLATIRGERGHQAHPTRTVVDTSVDATRWWTWAGGTGNATLAAALPNVIDPDRAVDNHCLVLRDDTDHKRLRNAIAELADTPLPGIDVNHDAVIALKFSDVLPPELAAATLAERGADKPAAAQVLQQDFQWLQ